MSSSHTLIFMVICFAWASYNFSSKIYYFNIPWDFVNIFTYWLTAWLADCYHVKISSFCHPIFYWPKWRISVSVPRLLLGSLIISHLTVIPAAIGNIILMHTIASQSSHGNCTLADRTQTFYWYILLPNIVLVVLIPSLLFPVSTLLLMFSLHRHLQQMRDNRPGPRDPTTQDPTMALKSFAFLFVGYTLHFLLLIISLTLSLGSGDLCRCLSAFQHPGAKQPQAEKCPEMMMLWKSLDKRQFILSYQYL
ncbi:hypothetical protein HPG69_016393 [Diceros bicornis minor]|uniref:Taste receptor type 2 n=1 Tax=Diceros bicornis minor TaxID=77932 RepID=A0A7J7EF79_DICBM|nr:hypothetical protein HPG69_016393 [Diceros bicornis minor]